MNAAMLFSYLKTAVRSLLRQRVYAVINIAGLAAGMACCILVLIYVRHETSYDSRHPHAERLFRVVSDESARYAQPIGPFLKQHMPEVEESARIRQPLHPLIGHGQVQHYRPVHFADATLLRLLYLPFVEGDPATALDAPRSMVLAREVAAVYFPPGGAVGSTLLWDNNHAYTVTGVVDIPADTHLDFEILASYSTLDTGAEFAGWPTDAWNPGGQGWHLVFTYVRLATSQPPADFSDRALALIERHHGSERRAEAERRAGIPRLQPVSDIHLSPTLLNEMSPGSRRQLVYGIGAIGVLVLVIAAINFVNLSTARSTTRAREVGIRKVVGADRRRLMGQFLGESLLTSTVAVLVALLLVRSLLPAFGALVGRHLSMDMLSNPSLAVIPLGVLLTCGILGGAYPAFALSGYRPVTVLRGRRVSAVGRIGLRRLLVVSQFAAAIGLIIGTRVVGEQLRLMQAKDLGFAGDQVVVARTAYPGVKQTLPAMVPELIKSPHIAAATTADPMPMGSARSPDMTQIQGAGTEIVDSGIFLGSSGYVDALGMALIAGRDFSHLDDVDFEKTLLTASATRALGYDRPEEAVGTTFVQYHVRGYTTTWDVIGVVEDFHYESLHHPIRPAFIQNIRPQGFWLVVRLTGDIPAGLVSLEEIWRRFVPHLPVQPVFLDQEYARFYASERRLSEALTWVSGLAVTVACMGILALSAFAAQQRTKEIGIRKALGASAASIVGMLSSDFARLVLAAGVVAAPLAWLAADRWLAGYAYRLELGWLPFVFACLLTTLAATLAVGLQTLRAAMANPVEALRYE